MSEAVQPEEQPDEQPAEEETRESQRVSKREFLARVATNSHIPLRTVNRVYDEILDELMETVKRGDQLMLTGFGKFYPQAHKGHRVQFAENGSQPISDYKVLKFSATRSVNKALALKPKGSWSESADPEADKADEAELMGTGKSGARAKRATKPDGTASLAAAATQSSRVLSRNKRQVVQGVVNDSLERTS